MSTTEAQICTLSQPDYYAVYRPSAKGGLAFVCHVLADSARTAAKLARDNGLRLPKGSTVRRIGRRAYFAALEAAMRA